MTMPTWGMAEVWNAALLEREERPVSKREKLWASELGRSPIDTWLKMKGTPYTNPPNARALRKFEAGNVFEWIVSLVLKRAGILKDGQKWCEHRYEGLLPVSGKADFIAGGTIDVKAAKDFIEFLERAEIPAVFLRCFDRIIEYLNKTYPNGVEEMPLEIKSVSAYAMDMLEKTRVANAMHRRQAFHYLIANGYEKSLLIYICRDDLRMMEFDVHKTPIEEQSYKNAIETVSKYYYADERPPLEKLIIWDDEYGRFSKNLGVEWSPYMTMLYGFKEPREYSEVYAKQATNWNRVLKRLKEQKKMTEKNEIILKEMRDAGYDPVAMAEQLRVDAAEVEEENGA